MSFLFQQKKKISEDIRYLSTKRKAKPKGKFSDDKMRKNQKTKRQNIFGGS